MASKEEQWVVGEYDAVDDRWEWLSPCFVDGSFDEYTVGEDLAKAERFSCQENAYDAALSWQAILPLATAEAIVEHWRVAKAIRREVTITIPGTVERITTTAKIVLSDKEAILADLARATDASEDE